MRKAVGSLAAAGLAAGLMAAIAGPAQANGSFDNHPDVRLFHPTPLPPPSDEAHPPVVVYEVFQTVLVDALALDRGYRLALAHELRKDAIRRAFGHRYVGFVKMYRGPRYPF